MYGYGTLAVLAESLCALIGLVIVRWKDTPAYKYILVVMLGLSVGTMCGDAILHLVPIVRKITSLKKNFDFRLIPLHKGLCFLLTKSFQPFLMAFFSCLKWLRKSHDCLWSGHVTAGC